MSASFHPVALAVFCGCFLLVTGAGFWAVRWRRSDLAGPGLADLDEWGLAGRKFGTLITWFLIGGDLYTAYTVIAVPAALFGAGAIGFFAIPYCIMSYPHDDAGAAPSLAYMPQLTVTLRWPITCAAVTRAAGFRSPSQLPEFWLPCPTSRCS